MNRLPFSESYNMILKNCEYDACQSAMLRVIDMTTFRVLVLAKPVTVRTRTKRR